MNLVLLLTIKLSIAVLIVAIGMGSTFADVTYLWRRPGLLARSVLAMYVVVPCAAFALVTVLPTSPGIKAAMLVLAVSAGAPLLPRKVGGIGNGAFVFSLVLTSSLLAIVIVPAWIALFAWHFGVTTSLPPRVVAIALAKTFLLPLAIGLAVRALAPAFSERVTDRLLAMSGLLLALAGLSLLVASWRILLEVQWLGMGALALLTLIALVIGHVLGGPRHDDRTALAIACATRHIGIAVVVATTFRGPRTLVLLVTYIAATTLVSIPYLRWRRASRAALPIAGT